MFTCLFHASACEISSKVSLVQVSVLDWQAASTPVLLSQDSLVSVGLFEVNVKTM